MVDRSLIGIAGAHFIAGEMSRRGYVVTLTSRNTEGIDLLASNKKGTKTIAIQVKTTEGKHSPRDWILSKKAEDNISDDLIYIFVSLKGDKMPEFFIVPSKDVANYVMEGHQKWLENPNKKGEPHKDTNIRMFKDREGKYLNRWDLLRLD